MKPLALRPHLSFLAVVAFVIFTASSALSQTNSPVIAEAAASTPLEALKQRATRGDANVQYALGLELGRSRLWHESNEWYLRAAQQGHAKAQHMMGVRLVFGQGVDRDLTEATKWFSKAAEQVEPNSLFSIGLRYMLGDVVPQDHVRAARWFRLAAEQGHVEAQRSLGRRYAAGEGVKQDPIEACKWYFVAADNGDTQAKGLATKLAESMTPAQVADAMVGAAAFIPKKRF